MGLEGDAADGGGAQASCAWVGQGAVGGDAGGGLEADEVYEAEAGAVGDVPSIVDQQRRARRQVGVAPGRRPGEVVAGEAAIRLVPRPEVRRPPVRLRQRRHQQDRPGRPQHRPCPMRPRSPGGGRAVQDEGERFACLDFPRDLLLELSGEDAALDAHARWSPLRGIPPQLFVSLQGCSSLFVL